MEKSRALGNSVALSKSKFAPYKLGKPHKEAIIRRFAAGEAVARLALDYDVSEASIRDLCARKVALKVMCGGREQTYLENIRWAMMTAGEFLRTGVRPDSCPNNSAWFLYRQAIDDPKDFLQKVSAAETRCDNVDTERASRLVNQRSLDEINSMILELTAQEKIDGEEKKEAAN